MAEVIVDQEKLAWGLEQGTMQTNAANSVHLRTNGYPAYALRAPLCGLMSMSLQTYCRQKDISAKLVLSEPGLDFAPDMTHVFSVIETPENDEPTVLDPTYSQFFNLVGLHPRYEIETRHRAYPEQKILQFRWPERLPAMRWLAQQALEFRENLPSDNYNYLSRSRPLWWATPEFLLKTYSAIWDPGNLVQWEPVSPNTRVAAGIISGYIPEGAIQVV